MGASDSHVGPLGVLEADVSMLPADLAGKDAMGVVSASDAKAQPHAISYGNCYHGQRPNRMAG